MSAWFAHCSMLDVFGLGFVVFIVLLAVWDGVDHIIDQIRRPR